MKDLRVNTNLILVFFVGLIVGSRFELLAQQNNWTPAICVAQVVEGDDLVLVEENGNSKVVKPNGKTQAVAVK